MEVLWVHLQIFCSGPLKWHRLSQSGSSAKQPAKGKIRRKIHIHIVSINEQVNYGEREQIRIGINLCILDCYLLPTHTHTIAISFTIRFFAGNRPANTN